MQINQYPTVVFGKECLLRLMDFDDNDRKVWKRLFDYWKTLDNGMRGYEARGINIPEGISEVAFCLFSGSKRFVSVTPKKSIPTSFDTYNLETSRAEQIKACSVISDLTSFGPKSKWDDLYFMDFYADGKLDGTFDVYKVPNEMIYGAMVNVSETFKDQQDQKRRPRFSIKEKIILQNNLSPIGKNVKIWLD